MIKREFNIKSNIEDMSLFLLGPRQTGKSTYLKSLDAELVLILNLLDPELFRDLQKNPNLLKEIAAATDKKIICIDEIQRIPELLDVVHTIIEENKKIRFVLTGSSARKLKKTGTNLLGGRAFPMYMHPLTFAEYKNLDELILYGGLPSVLTSKQPLKKLKAYVGVYLQEEIKAEGYVRNLSDFSKFLDVAALCNAEQLDYESVASDVQISARTVSSYYQILQDTLTGYLLEPYKKTKTRKAVSKPKFYFFDIGVANYLCGRESLAKGTPEYGKAVEHLIFTEILAYRDYFEQDFEIYYWRSTSQFEVDFIIQTKDKKIWAIEVKASQKIKSADLKGIRAFEDDVVLHKKIVISLEERKRTTDEGFEIYPVEDFLNAMWDKKLF